MHGKAPTSATARPPSEPSVAFSLFRTVAIVLFLVGVTGAIEATPTSGAVPDSSATAGLTQSLKGFFTRLWGPGTSDAEKLGTAYIYDEDGSLLSETGTGGANSGGTVNYIYLPTANGPIPIAAEINGQMHAVHSDHLNTPRRLTDSQGQAAWQWAYSAFGDEKPTIAANRFANLDVNPNPGITHMSPVEFNLRYPNHYADKESGLFENRNRFYSPPTGRYTQGDAFGLDAGPNRFIYALGDPLSVFDDDGLAPKKPTGVAPYSPLSGGTIKPSPISGWKPEQIGAPGGARLGGAGAGRGSVTPFCPSGELSAGTGGIGRNGALNEAKRDLNIPRSQHPDAVGGVPMTDRNGTGILGSDGKPIMTREYMYTRPDGSKVVIQDHSAGHGFGQGGAGDQGSHFNVRPLENTRNGSVPGTKEHYSW